MKIGSAKLDKKKMNLRILFSDLLINYSKQSIIPKPHDIR